MSTQIPAEIVEIIERKKIAMLEERRQDEELNQRKLEEATEQGKVIFNVWLENVILKTPEWIRPYLDQECEIDYVRIASGWDRPENMVLYFSVPGLAKITFNPKDNQWKCETSGWHHDYDDADQPYLHFNNSSYWRNDVEYIVECAQQEMQKYEEYMAQYAVQQEERVRMAAQRAKEEAEREDRNREAEILGELKHQKEQAEEQALFNAIKADPIAVHMLKAFVLLRDERSTFEQRIYEMDESMGSMENYWSNKATDLRRQASEAQRRADEEHSRASDLQYELEDAEKKLKKAGRGW